jgi:hypothetical protein
VRIGLIGFVAVALAFAAGMALRLAGGESGAVAPKVARSLDGGAAVRGRGLVHIDPGTLPAPTRRPPNAPAASPAQTSVTVGGPGAVAPGVAPAPAAPPAPAPGSPGQGGTFDSPGQGDPSQENSFDSEG